MWSRFGTPDSLDVHGGPGAVVLLGGFGRQGLQGVGMRGLRGSGTVFLALGAVLSVGGLLLATAQSMRCAGVVLCGCSLAPLLPRSSASHCSPTTS